MFVMNKLIRSRWRVIWCILPLPLKSTYDDVAETETAALLRKEKSEESGGDRLRAMFTLSYTEMSQELHSCLQIGLVGVFFGTMYGGFIRSREAYLQFFEQNQATAFKSHWEAKKVLQDHVTVNFAKGAFAWGWRMGMFTGTVALLSTSVSVYRGKCGIIEYVVAGGVTGSLFRMNLGLRGMIVGGLLGTALGAIGGSIIFACFKISGTSMEDIRSLQYKSHEYRMKAILLRDKKLSEEGIKEEKFLEYHDKKIKTEASSDVLPKW